MKKLTALVLLILCASMSFAQETASTPDRIRERKNSLAGDMFPMFKGFIASDIRGETLFFCGAISYERLIAPHFSFGANLDIYFGRTYIIFSRDTLFYFGTAVEGRYYPLSENFEKFFVGTTFGFNLASISGYTGPSYGGFFGLIAALKSGYKILIKNFYLEPSLAYVLSKTSSYGLYVTPLGWEGGLRIGFVF